MHVVGGVAVLTEHPFFIVDILLQVKVAFGMQFRLSVSIGIESGVVGRLHQPLIGGTDTLAPVVAGGTGFHGDTGVFNIMDFDFALS